jgi:hypothetical protein
MNPGSGNHIPSRAFFEFVGCSFVAPAGTTVQNTGCQPVTTRLSVTVMVFGLRTSYLKQVWPLAPRLTLGGIPH